MSLQTENQRTPEPASIKYGLAVQENPLRFLFQSSTNVNEVHVCDLDPWDYDEGTGRQTRVWERCTCQNFMFRIQPMLKSGTVKPDTDAARCKHILRARNILANKARDMIVDHIYK